MALIFLPHYLLLSAYLLIAQDMSLPFCFQHSVMGLMNISSYRTINIKFSCYLRIFMGFSSFTYFDLGIGSKVDKLFFIQNSVQRTTIGFYQKEKEIVTLEVI